MRMKALKIRSAQCYEFLFWGSIVYSIVLLIFLFQANLSAPIMADFISKATTLLSIGDIGYLLKEKLAALKQAQVQFIN